MTVDFTAVISAKARRIFRILLVVRWSRSAAPNRQIAHPDRPQRKERAVQLMTMRGLSESISATPLSHGTRSRTFPLGRVCGAPGCSTVLSRYNSATRCSLHGTRH
jgi:hypothetical protein